MLENFFLKKNSISTEEFHVSVISDLLYLNEKYKKNKLELESSTFFSRYHDLRRMIDDGIVNFIELDQQILIDNLFEEDENGVVTLDPKASRSTISPRFSISLLCLKASGCSCYWGENVFDEMEVSFLVEEYG